MVENGFLKEDGAEFDLGENVSNENEKQKQKELLEKQIAFEKEQEANEKEILLEQKRKKLRLKMISWAILFCGFLFIIYLMYSLILK